MYNVELEFFQGPLDLLLHLIEKMEIDIHNIPIAKLTEGYLEYIKNIEQISLENAEDYIVMASTLIHIKSRSLLPKEYDDSIDMEEELIVKLIDYKNYKDIQNILFELQIQRSNFGEKENDDILLESKLMDMSAEKLYVAFRRILDNYNRKNILGKNIKYRKEISIEIIRENLTSYIKNKKKIKFEDLIFNYDSKEELVAVFLCILNMLKEQLIICSKLGETLYIENKTI